MASPPDRRQPSRDVMVHPTRPAARVCRHPRPVQLGAIGPYRGQHPLAAMYVPTYMGVGSVWSTY